MSEAYVRAAELKGRRVVDIETAEDVGVVDGVAYSPDGLEVAALVLEQGLLSFGEPPAIPWNRIHSIGPDAVMTEHNGDNGDAVESDPDVAERVGDGASVESITVLSAGGHRLGRLADLILERESGEVVAYEIEDDEEVRAGRPAFVRANQPLSISGDTLVLPEGLEGELLSDLGDIVQRAAAAQSPRTDDQPARTSDEAVDLNELRRDELYERAQRAEIPGRSQMTKAELVDALAEAEGR